MKKYEGLFILNTAGKEETVKDVIDKLTADITAAGGKIETVQKMDKKPFSRITDRNRTSGFYVNFIFEGEPKLVSGLRVKFGLNDDVYRVLFSEASAPVPVAAVVAK